MKKLVAALLCALLCATLLCGCNTAFPAKTDKPIASPDKTAGDFSLFGTKKAQETAVPTEAQTPEATTATPEETNTPAPTAVSPGSGNKDNFLDEELLEFFRQVVIGSDPSDAVVYKWTTPVIVTFSGDFNDADIEQITNVFDMFNDYKNFPGITYLGVAGADAVSNLSITFATSAEIQELQANYKPTYPSYANFREDDCAITEAKIYLATDVAKTQIERNLNLTWGIFYALGMYHDSDQYTDSVFNFNIDLSQPGITFPAQADWYIVSMLYYPGVKPGMTYEQATAALTEQ